MPITPENIAVNQNSSVLIHIAIDDPLRKLAKNSFNLEPKDFQKVMAGKHSLAKLLYYLYCQELKTFQLIKSRQELLITVSRRLLDEQTLIQQAMNNPELKPELRIEYEERISTIQRLERLTLKLEHNLKNLHTKWERVRINRGSLLHQFSDQATDFKNNLALQLRKNGLHSLQEDEVNKASQILLGMINEELSAQDEKDRLAEIPTEIKKLWEE